MTKAEYIEKRVEQLERSDVAHYLFRIAETVARIASKEYDREVTNGVNTPEVILAKYDALGVYGNR